MRVAVDPVTGDFSDVRSKFLGPKAIKLCRVTVQGAAGVMALSTRAWLVYNYHNRCARCLLSLLKFCCCMWTVVC
jgi:splicing factor 3B subunit 3